MLRRMLLHMVPPSFPVHFDRYTGSRFELQASLFLSWNLKDKKKWATKETKRLKSTLLARVRVRVGVRVKLRLEVRVKVGN